MSRWLRAAAMVLLGASGVLRAEDGPPVRAGLVRHFAADGITGLTDGGIVEVWPDRSPRGKDAAAPAAENAPVLVYGQANGRPVVRFDGVDDYFVFPEMANIHTVFWVGREDPNATGWRCLLGHATRSDFHRGDNGALWSSQYATMGLLLATTCVNGHVVHGIKTVVPTEYAVISVRSVSALAANQLSRDRDKIKRVWDGDIAEVLIYNRVLSIEEEAAVGYYLQEKYGIAGQYTRPAAVRHAPVHSGSGGTLLSQAASPITVQVDLADRRQVIRHFGASDCWSVQYVGKWPSEKVEAMADLLFSTELDAEKNPRGIGLSSWRFNLGAGSYRQTNISDPWRRADTFYTSGFDGYNWKRLAGQRRFLQEATERGVEHFTMFVNSPPINMTKNGIAFCYPESGSTNLAPDRADDFAQYLVDVLKGLEEQEGVVFDSVSPFNEPQWEWQGGQEGCRYGYADMYAVVQELGPRLETEGLRTQVEMPESGSLGDLCQYDSWGHDYIGTFFKPTSAYFVGHWAAPTTCGHSYFTCWPEDNRLIGIREKLKTGLGRVPGLEYTMSEYCIYIPNADWVTSTYRDYGVGRDLGIDAALWVARVIHHDLTIADASAWQWWLAISPYDYKDGLIYVDKQEAEGNYSASKMLWAMGNFSRFVRPGMVRVGLERDDGLSLYGQTTDLMMSAYYDAGGHVAAVICVNWAYTRRSIRPVFSDEDTERPFAWVIPYVTADGAPGRDSLTAYAALPASAAVDIPARSVVTLVYQAAKAGDAEPDGDVDAYDLRTFAEEWLSTGEAGGDLDGDGAVNMKDWAIFAATWGSEL